MNKIDAAIEILAKRKAVYDAGVVVLDVSGEVVNAPSGDFDMSEVARWNEVFNVAHAARVQQLEELAAAVEAAENAMTDEEFAEYDARANAVRL